MLLTDARELAVSLMREHGLMQAGWGFAFDNAKRRFGQCNHTHRRITLSRDLVALNSEDEVRDVILHEIAHALVGPRQGHNHVWKAKCRAIGAKPERCHTAETPDGNWVAFCPSCGSKYTRFRKPKRLNTWHCRCLPGHGPETNLRWLDSRVASDRYAIRKLEKSLTSVSA